MNAHDFLDHAEELARDGRAAWSRSAVSRAYYAAHHAATDFLFRVGVRTPRAGAAHIAAFNALIAVQDTDRLVHQAGDDLMILHEKRNRADYRWNDLNFEKQDQALVLVAIARDLINTLEECLQDQDRADDVWSHYQTWVPAHGAALGLTLVR